MTLTIPSDPDGNTILQVVPRFWIQHTYQGDLRIQLIGPSGTTATLVNRPGTIGPGATATGFSNDDYGGFHQCQNNGLYGFEPMFFNDQGFCFSSGNYFPNPYALPAVAFPGVVFTPPPVIDCTILPCFGTQWGPWAPNQPLSAFAGQSKAGTWKLHVEDFYPGDTGNIRYFGLDILTITEPTAIITSPSQYSCVCNPTQIIGTANDAGGTIQGYIVEFSSSALGPWTTIGGGSSPVIGGVLATWNTSLVAEGQYFLRLTVTNYDGTRSQFTTAVDVDQTFSGISIRSPLANALVRGSVCPDGTMTDYCFQQYQVQYAAPPYSAFFPVDSANPVYFTPIINDPLASWNTTLLPDGPYRLRFTGTTSCGNVGTVTRDVTIDNTPPVAVITGPPNCAYYCGTIAITGMVSDANIAGWTLEYAGGDAHTWQTIASGTTNISGTLANWNTSSLRRCSYMLRLIASDKAQDCNGYPNTTEYLWSVNIGAYSNCDGSSVAPILNANDFQCFLNKYAAEGSCPQ
jgi:hypothetical protein